MHTSSRAAGAALGGILALALPAFATDYYVATTGNDANDGLSAETAFVTIDKAIASAANDSDVIHVAPGTYSTSEQYGPNLKAKLAGTGASRDDVVIQSGGAYRTLRTAAGSWLENVTVVGNADISKVDKGGAIEMSGGTVTNCVIRDGTAKGNDSHNAGGNIYSSSAASLVVDCVISGGSAQRRGGNVCLDQGTLRNCTITGGSTSGGSQQNNGGNVWTYQGKIENCTISGGSAELGGNVYVYNSVASVSGGTISGGTATQYGGNVYLRQGTISGATVSGGSTTATSGNYGGGNVYADGNAVVSGCVILDGSAYRRGGNVYLVTGIVRDCAISNGVCSANIGGNVYMEGATMTNSTVYGGSAPAGRGGNVFLNNAAALVADCTIEAGAAGTQGGNLYVGSGTVSDSTVANGTANSFGGNVYLDAGLVSDCTVSGGTIESTNSNWDGPKGVNVHLNGASAKLLRCHVLGGTTTPVKEDGSFHYNRGSVSVNNAGATVDNCLVEGSACGGVLMQASGSIYSSTIVSNGQYGVWAWNSNQHVFNTVIYGHASGGSNADWNGDMPDGPSADFLNNALSLSGRFSDYVYPTIVLLASADAFADYANGDYRPIPGSALVDAGWTDSRSDASTTDLAGNPRLSGTIDIGCYELQKSEMTVSCTYAAALEHTYAPATAAFDLSVQNAPEGATVTFTVDFGDGSEPEVTTETTVSHLYGNAGRYTVNVYASAGLFDTAEATYTDYVVLSSRTIFVAAGNAEPAFPYDTPGTGYATVQEAYRDAVDGTEILVGPGTYSLSSPLEVAKAVTIRGTGASPEAAVLRNTVATPGHRTLSVNHAAALVSNLTLENGFNSIGANLHLAAGVVSNCVIRGGTAVASDGVNAAGSGVELAGAATLTHCVVSNNVVQGTSSDGGITGGAIYVPYNSKNGRISNCLVAYNRYVASGETVKAGAAGIRFFGSNDNAAVENCTVVANTVEGELADDSAGIYCTSWNVRLRNNLVVANLETGKGRYTAVRMEAEHGTYDHNLTDADATAASLFRDFARGRFSILPTGRAYNAGTLSGLALQPSVDLAGNPRVRFDRIDIGCYECQNLPATVIVVR